MVLQIYPAFLGYLLLQVDRPFQAYLPADQRTRYQALVDPSYRLAYCEARQDHLVVAGAEGMGSSAASVAAAAVEAADQVGQIVAAAALVHQVLLAMFFVSCWPAERIQSLEAAHAVW